MVGSAESKRKLFDGLNKLPLLGETADPVQAVVLIILVVLTLIGVAIPHSIFPHDKEARGHVLQMAGGLLVVIGVYWAAVTIRESRALQYAERTTRAIDQLGSPSEAVRIGGIRMLQSIVAETPYLPRDSATRKAESARAAAVGEALEVVAEEATKAGQVAKAVLQDLDWRRD